MANPKIQTETELRDATDAEVRAQIAYNKKMRDTFNELSPNKRKFAKSKFDDQADSDYLNLETYSRLPKEDIRLASNLVEAGKSIEEADAEKLRESRKGSKVEPQSTLNKFRSYMRKPLNELKKGGKVSSASKRADGIAQRGKTKGRII